jgi:hypothetical protein
MNQFSSDNAGDQPPLRELSIDIVDLEAAFQNFSDEIGYYLDIETGNVVLVTDDARRELDAILSEISAGPNGEIEMEAIETAVENSESADWIAEMVLEAALVEILPARFIDVPRSESSENFAVMEAFIETVADERFQNQLWNAIRQRRPFRRFKDALMDDPVEQERWFAFERAEIRRRIQSWLEDEGIHATFVNNV